MSVCMRVCVCVCMRLCVLEQSLAPFAPVPLPSLPLADGDAFLEKKKQDIEYDHVVVEPDHEDTQVLDFEEDEDGELSQTHPHQVGGLTQEQHHEEQYQASQADIETQALDAEETQDMSAGTATASQLADLLGEIDLTKPKIKVQVVCGEDDIIEQELECLVKQTDFNGLFSQIDMGRFKDANLSSSDFTIKEWKLVADPQVNPSKQEAKMTNSKQEKDDGYAHMMKSKMNKMADHRNPIIFTCKLSGINKMTQFKSAATSADGGATK